LRHYDTNRKHTGSIPDEIIGYFNWPNPSSRTVAMGSTQPLTEMIARNLPGDKGRPERKADNLTAICELTVYKNVEASTPRNLWASTAYYKNRFFPFIIIISWVKIYEYIRI
jgi:hypothetical protein